MNHMWNSCLVGVALVAFAHCSDNPAFRDTQSPVADVAARDHAVEQFRDGRLQDQSRDAPRMVSFSGTHRDWKGKPLAGASVCLYENGKKSSQCVLTDGKGAFVISVPANVESGLFSDAPGYEKALSVFVVTQDYTSPPGGIYDDATATTEYGKVGSTYPPVGKGHIAVTAPAGATFAVYPRGGIGPHYAGSGGLLDPTLTKMQFGWGMVFDLAPGIYDVACIKDGTTCIAPLGWPSQSYTARLPVVDGYFSQVDCTCK